MTNSPRPLLLQFTISSAAHQELLNDSMQRLSSRGVMTRDSPSQGTKGAGTTVLIWIGLEIAELAVQELWSLTKAGISLRVLTEDRQPVTEVLEPVDEAELREHLGLAFGWQEERGDD